MSEIPENRPVKMIIDNQFSKLGGRNVGQYPLHHFAFDYKPLPLKNWPLKIAFCGNDEWKQGCWRFRKHSETFAVEFVTQGTFEFTQNKEKFLIKQNEIFFVQAGADSDIRLPADCKYATKRTISITGPLLQTLLSQLELNEVNVMTPNDPGVIHQFCDRTYELLSGNDSEKYFKSSLIAYEFLLTLSEHRKHSGQPLVLQQILQLMDSQLDRPLKVNDLARGFQMSPASLHRLFKTHLKDTPINVFIRKRMEMAMSLLKQTTHNIKEIAYRTGYSDALYFSSQFKKHCGESPSDYRRRQQFERDFHHYS